MNNNTTELPDLAEATFQQLQDSLQAGLFTSVDLVKAYFARIQEVNPVLRAVICASPVALQEAARLDEERKQGQVRGILHGIPIAVKDNIATRYEDGMDTTAGSFALKGAITPGDAMVIKKLKDAGAIVLCKLNLSVWANYRGVEPGAWSPIGGQCTSPYYPNGHPSGSSAGSGVATAAGLCAASLGSETNGSIVSPSNFNALCGVRPTLGLVPQAGVVPISSFKGATLCLTSDMCEPRRSRANGSNGYRRGSPTPSDCWRCDNERQARQRQITSNYLKTDAFQGVNLVVPWNLFKWEKDAGHVKDKSLGLYKKAKFEEAIETIRSLGATVHVVDVDTTKWQPMINDWPMRDITMGTEFKHDLAKHLAESKYIPSGVKDLASLIDFTAKSPDESPKGYATQTRFEKAIKQGGLQDPAYTAALAKERSAGALIEAVMKTYNAAAMVLPDKHTGLWADMAWPQVIVPMGCLPSDTELVPHQDDDGKTVDLPHPVFDKHPNQCADQHRLLCSLAKERSIRPFGITFAGTAFSEATLLGFAYAFEQATQARAGCKLYPEATPKIQLKDVVT